MTMATLYTQIYSAPCGDLLLGSLGEELCLCEWATRAGRCGALAQKLGADVLDAPSPVIEQAVRELDEYFAGGRRQFDVPLLRVGTDFQKHVWQALLDIPFGQARSYAWLAQRVGHPKAARAVGAALRANRIAIFIPCHRVTGSDGGLTGFAGGLPAKEFLLKIEQCSRGSQEDS